MNNKILAYISVTTIISSLATYALLSQSKPEAKELKREAIVLPKDFSNQEKKGVEVPQNNKQNVKYSPIPTIKPQQEETPSLCQPKHTNPILPENYYKTIEGENILRAKIVLQKDEPEANRIINLSGLTRLQNVLVNGQSTFAYTPIKGSETPYKYVLHFSKSNHTIERLKDYIVYDISTGKQYKAKGQNLDEHLSAFKIVSLDYNQDKKIKETKTGSDEINLFFVNGSKVITPINSYSKTITGSIALGNTLAFERLLDSSGNFIYAGATPIPQQKQSYMANIQRFQNFRFSKDGKSFIASPNFNIIRPLNEDLEYNEGTQLRFKLISSTERRKIVFENKEYGIKIWLKQVSYNENKEPVFSIGQEGEGFGIARGADKFYIGSIKS